MAFAEKRGQWYRIVFRFGSRRYRHALKTQDRAVAESVAGGINRTLMLLEQKVLQIPEGADPLTFVLSGGLVAKCPEPNAPAKAPVTLGQLTDSYLGMLAGGSVEKNTLDTLAMHLRHFAKTLGRQFHLQELTMSNLQDHVNERASAKGIHGRKLSPATMRKEIASFRVAWNWGVDAGLLKRPFPNKGVRFPKSNEKPPFQTWSEIADRISAGGLTDHRFAELWESLFLQPAEIAELLEYVRVHATQPWVYPLVCMAAHTGARRSELLRCETHDLDFARDTILIHEKKRVRNMRTTRRVTMTPFLKKVMTDWLVQHPGGQNVFAQAAEIVRSRKKRSLPTPVTRDEAHDHLKRTLQGSKWEVLRGFHVLRHSYVSCLAAAGIDQRIIDDLVGHQTEEQRKRYRHLTPELKQEAVRRVFG